MTAYWLTLLAMLAAGLAVVIVPLLRHGAGLASTRVTAVLVVVILPLLAVVLYATVGTRPVTNDFTALWQEARSAVEAGDLATGLRNFAEARRFDGDRTADFMLDYAETLLQANPESLAGEAGVMIEAVVRADPTNPRALWYGGLVAARGGKFDEAIRRWRTLLATGVPDDVRAALERQIEALESHAGQGDAATGPGITVNVALDERFRETVPGTTPVFVLARAAAGGPPLAAVRRQAADLPFTVTLTDADAMLAGRKLSDQDVVTIVARVALGGTPQATAGDIYASVDHNRSDGSPAAPAAVSLTMNSVVE